MNLELKIIGLSLLLTLAIASPRAIGSEILWSQYCQHLGKMKLLVHLDSDPTVGAKGEPDTASLFVREDEQQKWQMIGTLPIDQLTATVLFEIEAWPRFTKRFFKVTCGDSMWEGIFRAEPAEGSVLKLAGLSCHKDIGWPWKEAIDELIARDPDIVFFSGDQIYENDYNSPMFLAKTAEEVPKGMKNYLEKYRKFGEAFRDLMRDRPTIMITDDHDVFANDLWGKGGLRMKGKRTTGGYPTHPSWVNAAEFTQTGHLPDPVNPGPHGDGVLAYYTALEYGGVHFAILEDRKFKSAPSEVITELIAPPGFEWPKERTTDFEIEVVLDPDYDCTQLDRPDLQLLGKEQEAFLANWSSDLKNAGKIGAVLSQSPWVHVAMYSPTSADTDSNAWPQSARNRALKAIGDAPVVLLHGDVHLGTLGRHGVDRFNDGPLTYSLPSFSSKASRRWEPLEPGKNRKPGAPENTGEFHDRFGNKVTMYGAGNGLNGYGIVLFDPKNRKIELQFHPMNEERKPIKAEVPGWPHTETFGASSETSFVHPGLLHSESELDFIKQKLAGGELPWKTAWDQLLESKMASLQYTPKPFATVVRGVRNNPDIGSSEMSNDASAAYAHALQWYLAGNKANAIKAIEILNTWAHTLESVSGHDARLLVGMDGVKFCNAAELIRHTSTEWSEEDQIHFEQMLREVFYPVIKDFYPTANGNWDASMIQTMIAMGIYLDDRAIFDRAVAYYRNGEGNGAIENYINAFGQCQESGRDQLHVQMGLGFLSCACEMAWKQGVDLYGAADNRLALGFEYTAKYNLGEDVPYERFVSVEARYDYESIARRGRGRFRPIYERIVNHYHHRLGLEMPYTRRVADNERPEGSHRQHMSWGTLTSHGLPGPNK